MEMHNRGWKGTYQHKSGAIYEDISIVKLNVRTTRNDKEVALVETNVVEAVLLVSSSWITRLTLAFLQMHQSN